MLKFDLRSISLGIAFATLLIVAFGATDASAQGITDCKACGVSCSPYGCTQSCIRVQYSDCYRFSMSCRGVCYTYYDYTYSSYQCQLSDWYPCYA